MNGCALAVRVGGSDLQRWPGARTFRACAPWFPCRCFAVSRNRLTGATPARVSGLARSRGFEAWRGLGGPIAPGWL